MSDTNLAAPAAPSAPAGEAVINQNPTTPPQPIGSQAPNAPVGDVEGSRLHPQSRREAARDAIRKAFERTSEPAPAKPKMGHNNPPEPMKREATPKKEAKKERPEPLDLRKRPADQPRERAEHGHFAPKEGSRRPGEQSQAGPGAQPRQGQPAQKHPYMELPAHTPFRDPPKRMSEQAKAEWHMAPESVRGDMHRMHREFSDAYKNLQSQTEVFRPIHCFHQLATSQGTTLERALDNYVGIEQKLRADPIAGLDVIVHNLNLRRDDGQQVTLRDIAWHVLNQTPDQHRATQLENSQGAIGRQLADLKRQQMAVAQQLQQLHYERRYAHLRGGVDRFAETHPRLDELGDLIVSELRAGYDLPTAYRRANLLRPAGSATQAAQTRAQTAQTRNQHTTDRSISGAPDSPSSMNGQGRRDKKPVGRRDSIAAAIRKVSGSL